MGHPRVAIIGGSGYAETLLGSLLPDLEAAGGALVAATLAGDDAFSNTAAKLSGAKCAIFSDYQEMLRAFHGEIDLCVIPTSIHWHARMSVDALAAKANVLVEKPLAGSVADALKITEARRGTERFVAVGFQDMYAPATHSIKEFLCEKSLGAVRRIHVSGNWPRPPSYYLRNDWAGKKSRDGWAVWDSPLNNAFAHFLNLALFFADGNPRGLADIATCAGKLLRHYPIETFDTARVELLSRDGVEIRCEFSHFDPALAHPILTVQCEEGSLLWQFEKRAVARDADGRVRGHWALDSAENSRQAMIRNILQCLQDGGRPLFTAEDALAHLRAVDCITGTLPIEDAPAHPSASRPEQGQLASVSDGLSKDGTGRS